MDINKMLEELRTELAQVNEAILTIERIAQGSGKRRGRPPKWLANVRESKGEKWRSTETQESKGSGSAVNRVWGAEK